MDPVVNRLSTTRRTAVLRCLVEGNSVRSTARIVGCAKNTVLKLLTDVGPICADLLDRLMQRLQPTFLEIDEMWGFIRRKDNRMFKAPPGAGTIWLWVAIDPDSKIVPAWYLGKRRHADANHFLSDLAGRLDCRVQISTDGHNDYDLAIDDAFAGDVDYARVVKHYGTTEDDRRRRYLSSTKEVMSGHPDLRSTSTSLIERQNLTVRMSMRRFTRKTNGFSKKFHNLWCATALHYAYYNLIRPHQSLNDLAPAVAARLVDGLWELEDLVRLLEGQEASPQRPNVLGEPASTTVRD